jgi:hypothetical protein
MRLAQIANGGSPGTIWLGSDTPAADGKQPQGGVIRSRARDIIHRDIKPINCTKPALLWLAGSLRELLK